MLGSKTSPWMVPAAAVCRGSAFTVATLTGGATGSGTRKTGSEAMGSVRTRDITAGCGGGAAELNVAIGIVNKTTANVIAATTVAVSGFRLRNGFNIASNLLSI